ncbi:hypothetical protein GmHk_16G046822 [Glycine max]|nr:hypothetical protein GmHk_16G046822 [Glycine max]
MKLSLSLLIHVVALTGGHTVDTTYIKEFMKHNSEEESMDVLLELAVALNSSLNVQLQNSQQYISTKNFISSTFNASLVVSLDPCIMPLDEVSFGLEVDLVAAFSNVATIIRSNEQGTQIDMDLLGKIFSDLKILEIVATTTSASSNIVEILISGVNPTIPLVLLSTSTLDMKTSYTTRALASLPFGFGLNPTNLLPVTPLVSLLTHTPAPDMHRPVNNNFHHVSSGMPLALNTQSQQENFGI